MMPTILTESGVFITLLCLKAHLVTHTDLSCCQFQSLLKAILPSHTALEGQPTYGFVVQLQIFVIQFSK